MSVKQYSTAREKKYPNERVKNALLFVCEQEIVSFPQFGEVLTRKDNNPKELTRRAIDLHVARLVELELLERKHFNYKTYLQPTRKGYEYVECSLPRTMPTSLEHTEYATTARIWAERRRPESIWIPDRSPDCVHTSEYRVDYNTFVGEERVSINVEVTPKSKERLRRIIRSLANTFMTNWYFTTPAVSRLLVRLMNEPEMWDISDQFIIRDFTYLHLYHDD